MHNTGDVPGHVMFVDRERPTAVVCGLPFTGDNNTIVRPEDILQSKQSC